MFRDCSDQQVIIQRSPEEVWQRFSNIQQWPSWCSVVASARLLSAELTEGSWLFFAPRVGVMPPIPLAIPILECVPGQKLVWGIRTPLTSQYHEFSFTLTEDGHTLVRNREWAEGPLAIVMGPLENSIRTLNQRWVDDLARSFA